MSRLENLKISMGKFGVEVDDYDEDVEEDLRPYLVPGADISQYMAITEHGNKVYLYPCYATLDRAVGRLEEYAADDIYAEVPVGVIDLDSGDFFRVGRVRVSLMEKPVWNLSEVTV
jgi:hypothetical protein